MSRVAVMSGTMQRFNGPPPEPPYQLIKQRAEEKWRKRGCPPGSPDEDWFTALRELHNEAAEMFGHGSGADSCHCGSQ
jgi:hypothetical protein